MNDSWDDDPFSDGGNTILGLDGDPFADPLLAPLNDAQRAAVLHGEGPLLVLAGAGSGKTRVITHRVAHLALRRRVAPWRILAVTFTNKAADEMRGRLFQLLGPVAASCQVSTFHALGATLLRREAERVGLTRSFVIYDDGDSMQLIRRAIKELGFEEELKPQQARFRIDQAKNEGKRPSALTASPLDRVGTQVRDVYERYEQLLRAANAIDFGGLLLELVELFRRDADVLDHYRRRFEYVLVDEFQDTNPIQYALIRLLCPPGCDNLCAVGDDDQSIYRWRGADPANILAFEKHFPGAAVVKLEQNYRSDGAILDAAYAVISKNPRRAEKRLWTDRDQGAPFELLFAGNERDEAKLVAQRIQSLARKGTSFADMAVFYRVNAQSRVLEEALRLSGVPYRVVRGRAFYDREEIKDAGAYLRLAINPRSDADLLRVINKPARGIGSTTVERLQAFAGAEGISIFEALERVAEIPKLNAGVIKRLRGFRELVERLTEEVAGAGEARVAFDRMLDISGLVRALQAEGTEESSERAENLREFLGAAGEFDRMRAESDQARARIGEQLSSDDAWLSIELTPLEAFLEQVSLLGDADSEDSSGKVSLMTLHAAKGLEFDAVFLTGLEEGVFPHMRAVGWNASGLGPDPEELAEERRLCYVGITRAKLRLFFSLARTRSLFGNMQFNDPSRFLKDIPPELFDFTSQRSVRADAPQPAQLHPRPQIRRGMGTTPVRSAGAPVIERERASFDPLPSSAEDDFDQRSDFERRAALKSSGARLPGPGDRVFHGSFGEGVVVSKNTPMGPNATLVVRFPGIGEKKILARFLKVL
ncbi:MAG: UvrD-helicase domain-containing protein [Myxococcales bacterium]|jgi:DNA helicase-2/ATP-dependent DNA helicase PcrA|nr:UvrD-helicase domain-containing protein [Myxococcales bacterium]